MEIKTTVPQLQVRTNLRSGVGGYINGVFYPDRSGVCGGTVTPPTPQPPTNPIGGGGFVGGAFYPDRSGTC